MDDPIYCAMGLDCVGDKRTECLGVADIDTEVAGFATRILNELDGFMDLAGLEDTACLGLDFLGLRPFFVLNEVAAYLINGRQALVCACLADKLCASDEQVVAGVSGGKLRDKMGGDALGTTEHHDGRIGRQPKVGALRVGGEVTDGGQEQVAPCSLIEHLGEWLDSTQLISDLTRKALCVKGGLIGGRTDALAGILMDERLEETGETFEQIDASKIIRLKQGSRDVIESSYPVKLLQVRLLEQVE